MSRSPWTLVAVLAAAGALWVMYEAMRSSAVSTDGDSKEGVQRGSALMSKSQVKTRHGLNERHGESGARVTTVSIEPQQAQVAVAVPTPAETMSSGIDVAAAAKRADTWQAQLRQSTEPEKRSAVWMEVRQALRSVDKTALLAALQTVILTRDLAVDRTGLHDTLLAAIESTESPIRLAAWQALINTGIQPSDVDKLRTQVLDAPRSDRSEMLLRLNWATRGDLNGPSADVALRCMSNAEDVKGTIRALQNAKLTDAIVARVVGYARTSVEAAQSAQHFVLNNLRDKNHEVVVFLLERANAGDSTAIFGLSQGMATRLRTV